MSQEFDEGITCSISCPRPIVLFLTSTGSIWEGNQKVTLGMDPALHITVILKRQKGPQHIKAWYQCEVLIQDAHVPSSAVI